MELLNVAFLELLVFQNVVEVLVQQVLFFEWQVLEQVFVKVNLEFVKLLDDLFLKLFVFLLVDQGINDDLLVLQLEV